MRLAFCLYKYFPHGGLQRDFLRIAQACIARGHQVKAYVLEWEGSCPDSLERIKVPSRGLSNIGRYQYFTRWVQHDLKTHPVDRVVGFNKMPGLDVYYAADPCFAEKARTLRKPWYRWTRRYRHFSAYERAIFAPEAHTRILSISERQKALFIQHYGTPAERIHDLPPGISRDRQPPANRMTVRTSIRQSLGLESDDLLVIQIGSGFRIKGIDRSLKALASLPEALAARTRYWVIGQDKAEPYLRQAEQLGLAGRVQFLGGRDDIPRFLLAADVLLHPAYNDNTGTVILEAIVSGLPVLTTEVCGYARYVTEAGAGRVVASTPFDQSELDHELNKMLKDHSARHQWSDNGIAFGQTADIYEMPERAADLILDIGA